VSPWCSSLIGQVSRYSFLPLLSRVSVGKVRVKCGKAKQGGHCVGKVYVLKPNKSVKGTRRPVAVLKVWFLSRFGGFVSLSLAARPLP
jgi:hypothetical protein